jgi:preprotein translocase subunit SecA
MVTNLLKKVFGSRNDRLVKKMSKTVAEITALEPAVEKLSDEALQAKTAEFRDRLAQGAHLDTLMGEAFAVVREAGRRVLGMRHFDVQMIGGMVLNDGRIAEMRTGEGKTLVATLAAYLNALPAKGVHVVTVNDYLARRDAAWMGRIYTFLGLSVGVINSSGGLGPDAASYALDFDFEPTPGGPGYRYLRAVTRREAYAADITYGTNNEFGFDYLRDNMAFTPEQRVQRDPFYAIVDEVDSILIDEARTPLIISGPSEGSTENYKKINAIIPHLTRQDPITNEEGKPDFGPGDYSVDEKARQAFLSEEGHQHVEEMLFGHGPARRGGEPLRSGQHRPHAPCLCRVARPRPLPPECGIYRARRPDRHRRRAHGPHHAGRRWSDGLHQAVEAKEGVAIQQGKPDPGIHHLPELFRLYPKLAGMTGTADTEALRIPADLRPGGRGHPHQQADDPRRPWRSGLSHRQGKVPGHRRG